MDQPPTPTLAASEALARISRRIEEDEAAAYAEFVKQMQCSEDRRGPILWFLGQKFEIHAYYHSFLVTDYEAIKGWYERDLQDRRDYVIQEAEEIICNWRAAIAQEFREKLAAHLLGRLHYWKAEVMKRARTFDVKESGADESGAAPCFETKNSLGEKTRHFREPNLELLKNQEGTLNRKNAAEALGVSERTLDRLVADTKLIPVGPGFTKRFKNKDLFRFFNKRKDDKIDKSRQG